MFASIEPEKELSPSNWNRLIPLTLFTTDSSLFACFYDYVLNNTGKR